MEHSPLREADDAGILEATGRRLEERGHSFVVDYRSPRVLTGRETLLPALAFSMCESPAALERLSRWESRGVCVVNSARSVANTHRERAIPLLAGRGVPTPESRVIACDGPLPGDGDADRLFSACWVKQATEHKTREGDVLFAADRSSVRKAVDRLRRHGLPRAVVQRHVDGDLVKFYGVANGEDGSGAAWFRWFYPKGEVTSGHAFDPRALSRIASLAADALELEVWGGDAVVTAAGQIVLIDVNAWPSFARFRDEAAEHIASRLAARLQRVASAAV